MTMNEEQAKILAKKIVEEVRSSGHEFWIDPQKHYDDHKELKRIQKLYDSITSKIGQGVIWTVLVGSFILAAISMGFKK